MADNPCLRGLTKECQIAEPAFYRRAVAYKLLMANVPKSLSKFLPHGLGQGLIGHNVFIPADTIIPFGMIFPPGTSFDPNLDPGDQLSPAWLQAYNDWIAGGGIGTMPPIIISPGVGNNNPQQQPVIPGTEVDLIADAGMILIRAGNVWSTQHEAGSATSYGYINNDAAVSFCNSYGGAGTSREIYRSILHFDLTGIDAGKTVSSGTLFLTGCADGNSPSVVQAAPDSVLYELANYSRFSGDASAAVNYGATDNLFTLSSDICAYLSLMTGGEAWLMMREANYDYANHDPGAGSQFYASFFGTKFSNGAKRPLLTITYH